MDVIELADGRLLEYVEKGDPAGRPVVHLHGTPGTAGVATLLDETARGSGVRLVSVSRPGYGASTPTPPGLASVGRDVAELADLLAIEEFAVLGVSGGGPFALAAATVAPDRVHRVLVAAGPGPYRQVLPEALGEDDDRALDLLGAGDVEGAVAAMTSDASRDLDGLRGLAPEEFAAAFSGGLPPGEGAYFAAHPEDRPAFFADVQRALTTYAGIVRDNLSWGDRWDIDLACVVAPVELSYGAVDAMVPPVHGEWLRERLPTARLTRHDGAAHGDVTFGLIGWLFATLDRAPDR